jgi:hypothetical protein
MEEALLHFLCFSVFSSSNHLTGYSIVVKKHNCLIEKSTQFPALAPGRFESLKDARFISLAEQRSSILWVNNDAAVWQRNVAAV